MRSHPRKRSLTVAMPTSHFDRRVSPRNTLVNTAGRGLSPQELTPTLSKLSNSFASLDSNVEMLEGGGAREGLSDECLSPVVTTRKWTKCYVERTNDKKTYHLFVEGSLRHLLSAHKVGEDFVLSQYADIASRLEEAKKSSANSTSSTSSMSWNGSKSSTQSAQQVLSARHGVNAVLRCNRLAKKFELFSHSCELCDGVLSRFTCGGDSPANGDRQLLGEIAHSLVYMKQAQTSCRRMTIELPFVHPDKSRVVWCPRAGTPKQTVRRSSLLSLGASETSPVRVMRTSSSSLSSATGIREMVRTGSSSDKSSSDVRDSSRVGIGMDDADTKTNSGSNSNSNSNSSSSSNSSSITTTTTAASSSSEDTAASQRLTSADGVGTASSILPRSTSIGSQDSSSSNYLTGSPSGKVKQGKWQDDEHRHRLLLMSKLPRWNDDVDSFCMSFHGHRIKCASSKNFVFASNQAGPDEKKEKSCLQFGKQDDEGARFALDYRWPLSPVQAFGIFLTACNWVGPKHNKE